MNKMAKDTLENCEGRKEGQTQITDPQRKKMLMKKLEKIKLNRSHGNISFCDMGSFYEGKLRNLKNNNVSLAKALAEQRQISQSWYDDVVALKEELHETRSDLLKYQVNENVDYDIAIQKAAERRIKEIADPLESAAKDCLVHVLGLADSMKTVKQLVASLLKISNEKKLSRSTPSNGSSGSRPPLTRTPKSPRKNVVHPMVEGHVLQPATIHLPRMTLEERRKYRLQERAEIQENTGMDVIGEHSNSLREEEEASPVEVESVIANQNRRDIIECVSAPILVENLIPETVYGTMALQEDSLPELDGSCIEIEKIAESKTSIDFEDPLEGSSWMHLKRKRGSKKRKSKSSVASEKRSNSLHLFVYSSSDSDEETCQRKIKDGSKLVTNEEMAVPNPPSVDNGLTVLCLTRLDEVDSRVCRRSQRRSKASQRTNCDPDNQEESRSVPMASFFIDETLINDSDNCQLQISGDDSPSASQMESTSSSMSAAAEVILPVTVITTTVSSSLPSASLVTSSVSDSTVTVKTMTTIHTTSSSANIPTDLTGHLSEDKINNATCLLESSMEMTECLTKDFILEIAASNETPQPVACGVQDDGLSYPINKTAIGPRRFFKGSEMEEVAEVFKPKEKTPYDLSMMETSVVDADSLKKGKENVPPKVETPEDCRTKEASMNLKDVSIVVEDIMKTPSLAGEFALLSHESPKEKRKICDEGHETKCMSSRKPVSGNKKRRGRKNKDESTARKVLKKRRKINFSPHQPTTPSPKEDAWSPTANKKKKRKVPPKPKAKTDQKSKAALCETNSLEDKPTDQSNPNLFCGFDSHSGVEGDKSSSQEEDLKVEMSAVYHLDSFEPKEAIPKVDENIDNDPLFNELLKEMTSLLKNNLENEEEFDPLTLASVMKECPEFPDIKKDDDSIQDVLVTSSAEVCSFPFNSSTSEEGVKARPKRAAARVASFKEPSLNKKLRQEAMKTKCKRKVQKSTSQKP